MITLESLAGRRGELERELRDLRERLKLDSSLSPEDREAKAQDATEAAGRVSGVTRELERLSALQKRIQEGSYGTCVGCGQPISPTRLGALPFALLCLPCQERKEKGILKSQSPGKDSWPGYGGRAMTVKGLERG